MEMKSAALCSCAFLLFKTITQPEGSSVGVFWEVSGCFFRCSEDEWKKRLAEPSAFAGF